MDDNLQGLIDAYSHEKDLHSSLLLFRREASFPKTSLWVNKNEVLANIMFRRIQIWNDVQGYSDANLSFDEFEETLKQNFSASFTHISHLSKLQDSLDSTKGDLGATLDIYNTMLEQLNSALQKSSKAWDLLSVWLLHSWIYNTSVEVYRRCLYDISNGLIEQYNGDRNMYNLAKNVAKGLRALVFAKEELIRKDVHLWEYSQDLYSQLSSQEQSLRGIMKKLSG